MNKLQKLLLRQHLSFRIKSYEDRINKAFEIERRGEIPDISVEDLIAQRKELLEELAMIETDVAG